MKNLLEILNLVLTGLSLLAGHKAAMYLALFFSLLPLISAQNQISTIIQIQPINYTLCPCPCQKLVPVQVTPFFQTDANCVYIHSVYSKGALFTSDYVDRGNRFVYHDIGEQTVAKPTYSHTSFWKIYYPWKNVSNSLNVPLVIQNILSSEYLTPTDSIIKSTQREVITQLTLSRRSLWYFSLEDQRYKIRNVQLEENLYSDEQLKSGWNEGRVFTDTIKRDSSDDFPGKYAFDIKPCYD